MAEKDLVAQRSGFGATSKYAETLAATQKVQREAGERAALLTKEADAARAQDKSSFLGELGSTTSILTGLVALGALSAGEEDVALGLAAGGLLGTSQKADTKNQNKEATIAAKDAAAESARGQELQASQTLLQSEAALELSRMDFVNNLIAGGQAELIPEGLAESIYGLTPAELTVAQKAWSRNSAAQNVYADMLTTSAFNGDAEGIKRAFTGMGFADDDPIMGMADEYGAAKSDVARDAALASMEPTLLSSATSTSAKAYAQVFESTGDRGAALKALVMLETPLGQTGRLAKERRKVVTDLMEAWKAATPEDMENIKKFIVEKAGSAGMAILEGTGGTDNIESYLAANDLAVFNAKVSNQLAVLGQDPDSDFMKLAPEEQLRQAMQMSFEKDQILQTGFKTRVYLPMIDKKSRELATNLAAAGATKTQQFMAESLISNISAHMSDGQIMSPEALSASIDDLSAKIEQAVVESDQGIIKNYISSTYSKENVEKVFALLVAPGFSDFWKSLFGTDVLAEKEEELAGGN